MEARISTVHLESKDPWRGEEMRMPIGVFAHIDMPSDDESVLVQGWQLFVLETLKYAATH